MGDGRGGIPAWQRVDYKPPVEHENQKEKAAGNDKSENADSTDRESKTDLPSNESTQIDNSTTNAALSRSQQQSAPPPVPPRQPSPASASASAPLTQSHSTQAPSRPPIITYPEHLTQPQKPPPLVTTSRLLNTAYVFAGLAATCYGLSKYLVGPMTEGLNVSRHDFHSRTQSKLDELNKRLEAIVSVDPSQDVLKGRGQHSRDASVMVDTASEDSDPTELYHRDIGTQTLEEDISKASQSSMSKHDAPEDMAEAHQQQLERIRTEATRIASNDLSSETQTIQEVRNIANMVREQLESITFPADGDGGSYSYGSTGAGFSNIYGTNHAAKKETGEFSKMKQEIRSMKGSLLSARNFSAGSVPAGRKDLFPAR